MEILLNICEAVSGMTSIARDNTKRSQRLIRLKELEEELWESSVTINMPESADNDQIELFKNAALIYMKRATGLPITDLHNHMDASISIINRLDRCKALLPLFIIGSEARSDSHRLAVLDLIARTPQSVLRDSTTSMIQCFWTQYDLAEDPDSNYLEILSASVSQCYIMTVFL